MIREKRFWNRQMRKKIEKKRGREIARARACERGGEREHARARATERHRERERERETGGGGGGGTSKKGLRVSKSQSRACMSLCTFCAPVRGHVCTYIHACHALVYDSGA